MIRVLKRGSLVLPLFVFSLFYCTSPNTEVDTNLPATDSLATVIESGDIILKCGYGPISGIIVNFLGEEIPMSHCAIASKSERGKVTLVHSISGELSKKDGVQTISLRRFMKDVKPGTFHVVRSRSDKTQRRQFAERAIKLSNQDIPFDHDFDQNDTSALYCSELVNFLHLREFGSDCFNLEKRGDIEVYVFNSILTRGAHDVLYKW